MEPPNNQRRPVALPATIHRGDSQSPVECTVTEISETGACLSVSNADFIPSTFMLSFACGTNVQRKCTVVPPKRGHKKTVLLPECNSFMGR
jgi:hypothetical protein